MINKLLGKTASFSKSSPHSVPKKIIITFNINRIVFANLFKIKVKSGQKTISVITANIAKINTQLFKLYSKLFCCC